MWEAGAGRSRAVSVPGWLLGSRSIDTVSLRMTTVIRMDNSGHMATFAISSHANDRKP